MSKDKSCQAMGRRNVKVVPPNFLPETVLSFKRNRKRPVSRDCSLALAMSAILA